MTTSVTTQVRLPPSFEGISSSAIHKTLHAPQRRRSYIAWITLVGIFFPPILISFGVISITPGRVVVILLLIPALGILLKSGRNKVASDFFAVALTAWMVGSSILNGGFRLYVGAEALELLGAYLVGRAFFFGPTSLRTFVQSFRRITVVLIALALFDTLSGQRITQDGFGITSALSQQVAMDNYRWGLVRASSVFEGGEHYGTFCVAAAAILFYSEISIRRILYVGICFFGCVLSLSSGPFMGLAIAAATFSYDRILKRYPWRWKALLITLAGFASILCVTFDHPVEWIIVHFTFDAGTGYVRIGTWNVALPLIGLSPFVGYGLIEWSSSADAVFYLSSVDCVWLVEALRYGLPAVVLFVLTMLSPFLAMRGISTFDTSMDNMRRGFSLAIVTMALIGLTVHFWDAPWLFLSLCIGIRASFAEYEAGQQAASLTLQRRINAYRNPAIQFG